MTLWRYGVNSPFPMAKTDLELRKLVEDNLATLVAGVNLALAGQNLSDLKESITRLGRGGALPAWYDVLDQSKALPSLNVKTIGSIIEMLLVAVMETGVLKGHLAAPLKINPARGVDIPVVKLGVKSPSKNYCTSEPFFSAYERLIGNEHDAIILLTDYQEAQKTPPLKLKITNYRYLFGSQIADQNLCKLALSLRPFVGKEGDGIAQRFFQFLAYVNQSDWLGKKLLILLPALQNEEAIRKGVEAMLASFDAENKAREKQGKTPIPSEYKDAIGKILSVTPHKNGLLTECDNWITTNVRDVARLPSGPEFEKLMTGPLNGEITMSFALQWRYNFSRVFGVEPKPEDDANNGDA